MSPETRAPERALLSEAEAWLEIAQVIFDGSESYLCRALDGLRSVEIGQREAMLARVTRHLVGPTFATTVSTDIGVAWAWEGSDEIAECKTLAALWLALEADDESRAPRSSGGRPAAENAPVGLPGAAHE